MLLVYPIICIIWILTSGTLQWAKLRITQFRIMIRQRSILLSQSILTDLSSIFTLYLPMFRKLSLFNLWLVRSVSKWISRRYFQQICSAICTALMKMKTATDHIRRLALAGYLTISTLWAIWKQCSTAQIQCLDVQIRQCGRMQTLTHLLINLTKQLTIVREWNTLLKLQR